MRILFGFLPLLFDFFPVRERVYARLASEKVRKIVGRFEVELHCDVLDRHFRTA